MMLFDRTIGNYVFNIADIAVTIGVIMLLFVYNRKKGLEEETISDNSVLELSENKD
jgi:lipoprotein signal peptidase